MSSAMSAVAPARRASDVVWAEVAAAALSCRAVLLLEGHQTGDQSHRKEHHGDREDHAQAADQSGLRPRAHLFGPPFGLFARSATSRKAISVAVSRVSARSLQCRAWVSRTPR